MTTRTYLASAVLALCLPLLTSAATLQELQAQLAQLMAQLSALQQGSAQAQTTTSQSTQATMQTSASAQCPNLTRNLFRGTRGSDVPSLQTFLISQNYLEAGNNTGFYGALTEAAVKQFQCKHLQICSGTASSNGYGAVGPKTRAAIKKVCTSAVTVGPMYSQTTYSTDTYAQGSYVTSTTTQTCTPLPTQTQSLTCPSGQTGAITQTRTSSCASGATTPIWNSWTTTGSTCSDVVSRAKLPLCVVAQSAITSTTDYTYAPYTGPHFDAACGTTATVGAQKGTWDTWLDIEVKNETSCSASIEDRLDYWVLARNTKTGKITPVRFKSVDGGAHSRAHIDLGQYQYRDDPTQFIIVYERHSDAAQCAKLTLVSSDTNTREELFPAGGTFNAKRTFDERLSTKPGFSNVWNWYEWRRTPVMADVLGDLQVPFFRTWLNLPISNIHGCNSNARNLGYDYRYCFANSTELDQIDNVMEELYARGVPVIANVHGTIFSETLVASLTENYTQPQKFADLFVKGNSSIWLWNANPGFYSLSNLKGITPQTFFESTYKYNRYDTVNPDFRYGVTEAVLKRYRSVIAAVEPGGEHNWHPSEIRSENRSEVEPFIAESIWYSKHFCNVAHWLGLYCIMPSMADNVTTDNDPSGALSAKVMLEKMQEVVPYTDFANLHVYTHDAVTTVDAFMSFVNSRIETYGALLGGKKIIVTEFGYSPQFNTATAADLVTRMRQVMASGASRIAGAGYWMDVALHHMDNVPNTEYDVFFDTAALQPFDAGAVCGVGEYCPLTTVRCSVVTDSCDDWSQTGKAWAYRINALYYNQFK